MNDIQRLKNIVNVNIPYITPAQLEKLSKEFKSSDKFPDIKSSFEFPPKSIELVIKLLYKKEFNKLNFFDILRLLNKLEQDSLKKIDNKFLFVELLQELFNNSEKYVQNLIIKIITLILNDNKKHSFREALLKNMISKEFLFIKLCIKKDFVAIQQAIKNQNLQTVLKYFGVNKVLFDLPLEYQNYLLKQLSKIYLSEDIIECYYNNLLNEDNLENLYHQLDVIISLIEEKQNIENNSFLDLIINKKLGNIEDSNSKWYKLAIPADLQERYKRLKGVFEFQRFVDIAEYLTSNKNIHFSSDKNSSDEKRLKNRSTFWSNYDERFSSVKMWVSEEDFRFMKIDKPVDLKDIKQLKNINNEACVLEFKDNNLLIIEFFRLKDGMIHFNSLIFDNQNNILKVKDMLNKYNFDTSLYEKLKEISNYTIRHNFLWQGWVDEFLRKRNIYPNTSILNGKKFISPIKLSYKKSIGLQATRNNALKQGIEYEDIIINKTMLKFLERH
jgi:hypothetical protein